VLLLLLFLTYAVVLSICLGARGIRSGPVSASRDTNQRPARVLIVGGTGGTGRQLVQQALERGHAVTALVRNPAALDITHSRLQVVRGNVLDYASVDAAMRGQDAVLSALGHKQFFRPTRILSEGTRNLLRAMETHGVGRLVCETSLGIGDGAWRMGLYYTFFVIPVVLPFYFWDKTRQEQLIAASRVNWVVARPGVLTNGARRGVYRHGRNVGNVLWTPRVSRADVADFMLNQLTHDEYLRSAPGVSG
jgi:putative NADH-flavin reductase